MVEFFKEKQVYKYFVIKIYSLLNKILITLDEVFFEMKVRGGLLLSHLPKGSRDVVARPSD